MIGHGGGIYSYRSVTNPLGLTWGCSVLSLIVLSALICFSMWVDSHGGLEDSPATISLNAELLG